GGSGNDTLTGGSGQDIFRFADSINTSNIDKITDFVVVDDTIQLSHTYFTSLSVAGGNYFHLGTAAVGVNDFILYNPSTGVLSYDADANGQGSAVHIATLGTSLTLTNADFMVI
ncbi:MAG: M10 family metallopeptidase C-terminal domain-containing protein, partial [Methylococcaceae bacterium]